MKILIVTSSKSGPLKNAHAISIYLAKKKNHVYVYLLDSPEYNLDWIDVTIDKPSKFASSLGYVGRIIRLATIRKIKFRPDVILVSFAISIPFFNIFFPRTPVVYRIMGFPRLQFSQGILKFAYAIEAWLAKRYAKKVPATTTSKYYQRLILNQWGAHVFCIPYGVDTDFYKPLENKNLKKLRLTHCDYIVTLGLTRFNDVYKPLTYIKWYLDALRNHKEKSILTLILGKTNHEQKNKIQKMIKEYLDKEKVANHFFKIDYIQNVFGLRNYYQVSDIFISFMPQSLMEKEALACGVPVITEFWEGENALKYLKELQHKFVKENFIKIVDTLLNNEKERTDFSKKGRFVAEMDFSSNIMGERYHVILKTVVRKAQQKEASTQTT